MMFKLKIFTFSCQYFFIFILLFWVLFKPFLFKKKQKKCIIAKAKIVNICHVHGVINFVLTPLWQKKLHCFQLKILPNNFEL